MASTKTAPRPKDDATWREVCVWHIDHYRRGMQGWGKANPSVCEKMMNRWIEALAQAEEDGTADDVRRL